MNTYKCTIYTDYKVQDKPEKWRNITKHEYVYIDSPDKVRAVRYVEGVTAKPILRKMPPWICDHKRDRKESFFRKMFEPRIKNIVLKRISTTELEKMVDYE